LHPRINTEALVVGPFFQDPPPQPHVLEKGTDNRGKIDLHADVNTYIKDFHPCDVPAAYHHGEFDDLQTVFERITNELLNSEDDIGLGGELR
jgi:hypothetical protein